MSAPKAPPPLDAPPDLFLRAIWRLRLWLFATVALLHGAAFTGRWLPGDDSAAFLTLARQITRTGSTATPVALDDGMMTGYAWWLAGVWALVGGVERAGAAVVVLAALAVNLVGLAVWMTAIARLLALRGQRELGVLLAFLTGIAVETAVRVVDVLPDLLFAAGLGVLLLGLERLSRGGRAAEEAARRSGLWVGWILVLTGAAAMLSLRTPAVLILGTWGLAETVRLFARGRVRLGLAVVGVLAAVGALGLWRIPGMADDAQTLLRVLQEDGPRRLAFNGGQLFGEHLGEALIGIDPGPMGWTLSAIALAGVAALFRQRLLWGLLVSVLLVQWVLFLSAPRYILPVLPLLLLGVWDLTADLGRALQRRWGDHGHLPVYVFAIVLVGGNLVGVIDLAREQWPRRSARLQLDGTGFTEARRIADALAAAGVAPGTLIRNRYDHPTAVMWWADVWSVPWLPYRSGGVRVESVGLQVRRPHSEGAPWRVESVD